MNCDPTELKPRLAVCGVAFFAYMYAAPIPICCECIANEPQIHSLREKNSKIKL